MTLQNQAAARAAMSAGKAALVWQTIIADSDTLVGAARRLIEPGRGDFLLESVEGGEVRGRYSLHGPACGGVRGDWRTDRDAFAPCQRDALSELRALADSCRIDVPEQLPSALACLVGYFGYETIGLVETLPRAEPSELALPDMLFVRPTLILVFDGLTDEMFCVAPLWPDEASRSDPDAAIASAGERIEEALRALSLRRPPEPHAEPDCPKPELTPVMDGEDYKALVARAKDYIRAGDIFQVVRSVG